MPPRKSSLVREDQCISFWIGRFSSQEELEAFIDSGAFEKEHGFTIEPPLLPFHAYGEDEAPARLLAGLIREPWLLEAAVNKLPRESFNAVIRHDGVRYDPAAAPRRKQRRMTFLGSFTPR